MMSPCQNKCISTHRAKFRHILSYKINDLSARVESPCFTFVTQDLHKPLLSAQTEAIEWHAKLIRCLKSEEIEISSRGLKSTKQIACPYDKIANVWDTAQCTIATLHLVPQL
jgi:hypothetical protein